MGTAQYVSPELLSEKSASRSSDLWALGCIIYQMVSGLPPFRSRWELVLYKKMFLLLLIPCCVLSYSVTCCKSFFTLVLVGVNI